MSSLATYQAWGQLKLHEIYFKKEKKKKRRKENKERKLLNMWAVGRENEMWQLKKKMVN